MPPADATGSQTYLEIVTDGNSGAIVAWNDDRPGDQDVHARKDFVRLEVPGRVVKRKAVLPQQGREHGRPDGHEQGRRRQGR